jgi:DNA gyrase inhibitor GyrI
MIVSLYLHKGVTAVDFHLEEMSNGRIAYMRNLGPYGSGNKELMERLKAWASDNGLFHASAVILGIARDDPALTPPERCRYDVWVTFELRRIGFAILL